MQEWALRVPRGEAFSMWWVQSEAFRDTLECKKLRPVSAKKTLIHQRTRPRDPRAPDFNVREGSSAEEWSVLRKKTLTFSMAGPPRPTRPSLTLKSGEGGCLPEVAR